MNKTKLAQRISEQVIEATEALQFLKDILDEDTRNSIEVINREQELRAELSDLSIAYLEVKQAIQSLI